MPRNSGTEALLKRAYWKPGREKWSMRRPLMSSRIIVCDSNQLIEHTLAETSCRLGFGNDAGRGMEAVPWCSSFPLWFFLVLPLVVPSLSCVHFFVTPWTAAPQALLSFTVFLSLFKLMSIESMMSYSCSYRDTSVLLERRVMVGTITNKQKSIL